MTEPRCPTSPHRSPADPVAALEALSAALAAIEPALEQLRGDAATMERARRAALHLRAEASRIVSSLDTAPAAFPRPWHGQERRSPNRATNVARLPERTGSAPPPEPPTVPTDWEPF
ncbi:hypothetical protein [Variovorax sp. YR752]|uniref:hypothetical protein n=1 Tax=Variovorax sp. YR752 TaxID=1884383 RepID=UPI003137B0F3